MTKKQPAPPPVPDGPTVEANPRGRPGDRDPVSPPVPIAPTDPPSSDEASSEEVTEVVEAQREAIRRLHEALGPLAALPMDTTKDPGQTLYELTRNGHTARITSADIARARTLLGIPL